MFVLWYKNVKDTMHSTVLKLKLKYGKATRGRQ